ncbi:hypothetical protein [Streptomyces sp. VB1]|uniref:hypothetical protein n=1 Tax=Streptomyces sp. VB1 TaxID=2986803 RepID=UPI002241FC7C|nr:hypothetical protein [Streptomyces sp. VB1]UZI26644.1 hypothetical protein OH133_00115 [Streptomyces sp. VB1]
MPASGGGNHGQGGRKCGNRRDRAIERWSAVYCVRAADSTTTLQEAREQALQAADDLIDAAGTALAG